MRDDDVCVNRPPPDGSREAPPWQVLLASAVLVVAAFAFLAQWGAYSAARDERVLAQLDPSAAFLRQWGGFLTTWTLRHARLASLAITAATGLLVSMALITGRRRALPFLLLGAGVAAVAWGQTLLLAEQVSAGVACYLTALALAALFGALCPAPSAAPKPRPRWWLDGTLAIAVALLTLLSRLYALTELPSFFAGEMSIAMLASRTIAGVLFWIPSALLGTSIGVAHLFPQMAFFQMFGTSVYALRLTAVAVSVLTAWLLYWLLRSMVGRRAALVATLLFATAPEQLWWGRNENVNYILVSFAGVLAATLGWWLRRRLSVRAALATAVWMAFGRFFYLAAVLLITYPWLLILHAGLFTRGIWRRLPKIVLVLAGGTGLWLLSLSIVDYFTTEHPWRFLNPARHGELVSRRGVEGRSAGTLDLLQMQAESLAHNATRVASAFTYRGWFSQWYQRHDTMQNPTWINVAVTALVALSLAYLLGQIHAPAAAVLLGWVLVGVLPAILSTAPDDRRMALAFPAFYACAGFACEGVARALRQRAGRLASWLFAALAAAGLVLVCVSSLTSHLQLRIHRLALTEAQRHTEEIFRTSDAIYYDGDEGWTQLTLLGHADGFLERPPCVQFVGPRDWLAVALQLPCTFADPVFQLTMPPGRIAELREHYRSPQRVTFLLSSEYRSRQALRLLQSLFPEVRPQWLTTEEAGLSNVAITVDRELIDRRRRPVVAAAAQTELPAGFEEDLLAGVGVRRVVDEDVASPSLRVRGGVLVDREDWYHVSLVPACDSATLSIDGLPVRPDEPPRPLLVGAHTFEIELPDPSRCARPMQIEIAAVTSAEEPLPPLLVSPEVTAVGEARPSPSALYDGYSDAGLLAGLRGQAFDARPSGDGGVVVLTQWLDGWWIERFDAESRPHSMHELRELHGVVVYGMSVGPQSEALLVTELGIFLFDASGRLQHRWSEKPFHTGEVAFLADGRIAASIPEHAAIEVFRQDGRREEVLERFPGEPGQLRDPMTIAVSAQGEIVVGQSDGTMLLFRSPLDRFEPEFVRSFRMRFTLPSVLPRSLVFDSADRIMAGDPERLRVLVYSTDGIRLLARDPQRDWTSIMQRIGDIRRFVPTPRYLYVLAGEPSLRRFRR